VPLAGGSAGYHDTLMIGGHVNRRLLVAGAVPLALTLLVSALGQAGAAQRNLSASHQPTWISYFFPTRIGLTCRESFASNGLSGDETLRVTAVSTSSLGTRVTVEESSATQVAGKDIPTNAALHYTITREGSLVSSPSAGMFGGQTAQLVGNTVLPSVGQLLSGRSFTASLHEIVPLSAAQLSQVRSALKPGQTSLQIALALRERGRLVPTLTVPLGTFHNVLEVSTSLGHVEVKNALPSAAKSFNAALEPTFRKELNFQTWYAKNTGPVQITLAGVMTRMTSCTG